MESFTTQSLTVGVFEEANKIQQTKIQQTKIQQTKIQQTEERRLADKENRQTIKKATQIMGYHHNLPDDIFVSRAMEELSKQYKWLLMESHNVEKGQMWNVSVSNNEVYVDGDFGIYTMGENLAVVLAELIVKCEIVEKEKRKNMEKDSAKKLDLPDKINLRNNINIYEIIERAVQEGLSYGWERRVWKHRDMVITESHEDKELVMGALSDAVMLYLTEVVDFNKIDSNEDLENTGW